MELTLHSAEELQAEAARLAQSLAPQEDRATLITLSGELGAGKTTFTQGFAKALGIEDAVTSPTFVLEKIYALPAGRQGFQRLAHIDAYRLKGGSELAPLGFDELMQDSRTIVVLEWPEMVAGSLPQPAHAVRLEVTPENARTLSYA